MLLLACSCAFAVDPALDVSQYAHTSWKYRDGFTRGTIETIVQTSDGYLWLGTTLGLYRFDGVRAVLWEPPANQPLPSSEILHLVAGRDGTLWIGTRNGLASWKDGRLSTYADLAGSSIFALLEDGQGSIWAGAYSSIDGKLCEIERGRVRCDSEIGGMVHGVMGLHEDAKGHLWVGVQSGVWRWKPGTPEFFASPDSVQSIQNSADGRILVSFRGGVSRLVDGKFEVEYPMPAAIRESRAYQILRDHEGGLWGGTPDRGIVHWHQGRTDVFAEADGLSGDSVSHLFEDREGSIWAATRNGLDRFREYPVVTYSGKEGLSGPPEAAVLAARDGSIWFSTVDAMNRMDRGQLTMYRRQNGAVSGGARQVLVSGMPRPSPAALAQDSRGRIWFTSPGAVGYLEGDRFISTPAPGGIAAAISPDSVGNMWITYQDLGLFRLSGRNEIERIPWDTFGRRDMGRALAIDPVQGGVWIGFAKGGIAYYRDRKVRASYSPADGLAGGMVQFLRFDSEGALWVGAEGGLSRFKDGRITTMTSKNGLPCDSVHWMQEDDEQSVWLMTSCGLARVARGELDAWAAGDGRQSFRVTVLDVSDGVLNRPGPGAQTPHAAKSGDGKLWFWNGGIGMVDPRHITYNKVPPPVQIEQITADRKAYGAGAKLPALVRDVVIDYTALSFAAPEKIKFRFKLEGRDRDWREVGNRRQAFYDDLPPRNYRFRVMAANNDGVWNEAGATLDFSVAPAYYQTTWFAALMAAGILGLLAAAYRLRLLYLKRQFEIRMEERVGERLRLARELHDTLLQSFQGVLLKFHAVMFALPDRPDDARKSLESAIEQARVAVTEGRDAVQGLRSSTVVKNDLARAITTFGEALASDSNGRQPPEFRVAVQGASRDLAPLVRDEVYRISGEALRNAFRHADARRIEVEIHYEKWLVRVRVRDDGKGIDPQVLGAGRRDGHHGLPGMRERAELVGGKLTVWSEQDSGTEIELTVPATIAYAKAQPAAAGGNGNLI